MSSWPSCTIPPLFPARGFESTATAELSPRYEDITQDGRVQLTALMPGLGAVWRTLDTSEVVDAFRDRGILPILRRLVIVGEQGPFSANVPFVCRGEWRLARERQGERIMLDMWLDVFAPIGSTLAPPPSADAPRVLVGRVYAEHVFTRPFADPVDRKVSRLDVPGLPELPEDEHPLESAEALIAGHALSDGGALSFGMQHTDSNQHVNSLVYPRVFEETAVQELRAHATVSAPDRLLARAVDLRYRKPLFAGQRAHVRLRADAAPRERGPYDAVALGAFFPAEDASKPSSALAMWFAH